MKRVFSQAEEGSWDLRYALRSYRRIRGGPSRLEPL